MFNVQHVVGTGFYKRANHADAEVGIALYMFSSPLILCLTLLVQVGIPLLTSESSAKLEPC